MRPTQPFNATDYRIDRDVSPEIRDILRHMVERQTQPTFLLDAAKRKLSDMYLASAVTVANAGDITWMHIFVAWCLYDPKQQNAAVGNLDEAINLAAAHNLPMATKLAAAMRAYYRPEPRDGGTHIEGDPLGDKIEMAFHEAFGAVTGFFGNLFGPKK